ncbi:HEAT repeat domain-containing protein [Roseateles sp. BYS78W]|uniref:HEAT repeat domain-containing protein n=1 Tax=Pelomonas candidula TaxID=3299025 RepID=A0ABW7HJB7_9BURK
MKRRVRRSFKHRSLRQLVRVALLAWNSDRCWDAICELRMRGSPATLALAQTLCRSGNWRKRALGVNIAAQLRQRVGSESVEYALVPTQQLLLSHLHDAREEIVDAAVAGLGHRPHADALPELVRLAAHRNRDIRFSVACALGSYFEPESVAVLLRLARDVDDDVRDWATFGLGTLHDVDTPEVRERLWQNLGDAEADVRGEAVIGLAVRGDARVIDHLLALGDDGWGSLDLNAAKKMASPRLLSALQALQRGVQRRADLNPGWLGELHLALAACSGTATAH